MKRIKQISIVGLFLFLVSGCAGIKTAHMIEPGHEVQVNYTCRALNGDVMTTTRRSIAENPAIAKSRVFSDQAEFKPVSIIVGQDMPGQIPGEVHFFDDELKSKLAHALGRKEMGKTYDLTIVSDIPKELEDRNRYRDVNRVRIRPGTKKVSRLGFTKAHHKEPKQGEILSKDNQPYARVMAVDPENVTLEYINLENTVLETPWGKARCVADKDHIVVTIEARVGTLVRTGGLIGRITAVDEKKFRVDYGHPFAGETLKCEVEILKENQKEQAVKPGGNPTEKQ